MDYYENEYNNNSESKNDNTVDLGAAIDTVTEETEKLGGRAALVDKFGHKTVELLKPFTYGGNTYTVIDMDFNSLCGLDYMRISDEMAAQRQDASNPVTNLRYQVKFAARAAHVGSDVIEHLPAADFNAVVTAAKYFLLVTG